MQFGRFCRGSTVAWALALGVVLPGAGPATANTEVGVAPPVTRALPYYNTPRISSVQVSPSNQHAAFLWVSNDGLPLLAVIDLANPTDVRTVAGSKLLQVSRFHWVNERRLVFDLEPPSLEYYEGEAGTSAIDLDGKRQQLLVLFTREVRQELGTTLRTKVLPMGWNFHGALHGRGDQALFSQRDSVEWGQRPIRSIARLNTETGGFERVSDGMPDNAVHHVSDAAGDLRIVITEHEGRGRIHHRAAGSSEWVVHEDLPVLDGARMTPLYIESDGSWIVSSRRGRDADALFVYDPKARKLDPEPLVAVAGFDVHGGLIVDPVKQSLVGVRIETSRPQTVWFDARLSQLQKAIDGLLPAGRTNTLLCGNCATAQRFVVHSSGDRMPGEYFVFDTVAKRLVSIAPSVPGLPEASQGKRSFHRVAARDGLSLPVVVTHPAGVAPDTPRPLVVHVHGGPWLRGASLQWDHEAQFLAARGYRVMQVEYRGSTGFGDKHYRASFRQWGQAMQDDLADAVAWAVREKMAEPGRACIVGASYGGYAALMGPVRHPELYRCAASAVGVTDLTKMFSRFWTDIPERFRRYDFNQMLGDPVADKAMLERFSPINRVADIKVPILVTWGGKDTRVDPAHSRRFVAAARAAGVAVESHEYVNEGHGLYLVENRVDEAERLARFLEKHLPPLPR
jgi:acetyl esterase/lipase